MYRLLLILNAVFFTLLFSSTFLFSTHAQTTDDTCPEIVETALAQVDEFCSGLGRNEACYGNVQIEANNFQQLPVEAFAVQGDIVSVTEIATLTTAPMNPNTRTWGVAVMALQANLPDTLLGQNVTFVLFGDVTLESDVLPDVDAGDFSAPMQAFRFSTGIGQPTCEEAPANGMLIQAPSQTTVAFNVNGVDISVGSTALLRLEDDAIRVSTLDGTVDIRSDNDTVEVATGFTARVNADEAPEDAEPYNFANVRTAPVRLLPEEVDIPLGPNVALNRPTTASNEIIDSPDGDFLSSYAVDGIQGTEDNWWGAGDLPPQWIEIDLESPFTIGEIRLLPSQFPTSTFTTHRIYGGENSADTLLAEISGVTTELEWINYAPETLWENIRYVRVETVESESWVSWREIEVIAVSPEFALSEAQSNNNSDDDDEDGDDSDYDEQEDDDEDDDDD